VPRWGVVSSAASPVLLIGGWTVAATLQPRPFNQMADTISALAAIGATDRWVMTLIFLVVAICDLVVAAALRPAAPSGRLILAAGAIAGMMVAVNPQHPGGSVSHAIWAALGFTGLAAWPAGAWRRGPRVPWGLRPAVCAGAVVAQAVLLAWFIWELVTATGQIGLAERFVVAAQAIWPLAVVVSCRAAAAAVPATAPVLKSPRAPRR
jgi:hypothetical membrane protein